jgi:hypothetical protein
LLDDLQIDLDSLLGLILELELARLVFKLFDVQGGPRSLLGFSRSQLPHWPCPAVNGDDPELG